MLNNLRLTPEKEKEIEDCFEELGCGITIGDLTDTYETLDDFEDSAKNYRSHNGFKKGVQNGLKFLIIKSAQLRKGDQRRDIVVVDLGGQRVVYSH